jgi:ABC-type transporter Mla subunit MlaD
MRGTIFRVLALVAVAALVLVFLIVRPIGHKLVLKSYLADARGLRAGAAVRLAGVDVGSVKSVRVQPQEKGAPVEVEYHPIRLEGSK